MTRRLSIALLASGLLWLTCAPPEVLTPTMFLTPRPRSIDDQGESSTIGVYVADSDGVPRTGTVTITVKAGAFATGGKAVTLDLDQGGRAEVDWSCRVATDGDCKGDVRFEARWESGSEFLVQVVRVAVGPRDAGTGVPGDGGTSFPLLTGTLSKYVADAGLWSFLARAAAVDSRDRLFVTDTTNIYKVENGVPSLWLAAADIDAGFPGDPIVDLDVAPDDQLYVLMGVANSMIARVPAAHQLEWVSTVDHTGFSFNLSAAAPNRFYVANGYNGLSEVTDAGTRLIYPIYVSDCAAPNLTAFDDFFFYTPGCNGSRIVGGRLDGSGSRDLFTPSGSAVGFGRSLVPNHVVALDQGAQRLLYLGPDGGSVRIATTPTLPQFASAQGGVFLWNYFDLVQGPTGTIYMVSGPDILKVSSTP